MSLGWFKCSPQHTPSGRQWLMNGSIIQVISSHLLSCIQINQQPKHTHKQSLLLQLKTPYGFNNTMATSNITVMMEEMSSQTLYHFFITNKVSTFSHCLSFNLKWHVWHFNGWVNESSSCSGMQWLALSLRGIRVWIWICWPNEGFLCGD